MDSFLLQFRHYYALALRPCQANLFAIILYIVENNPFIPGIRADGYRIGTFTFAQKWIHFMI